jgi:hypothetical protein
MDSRFMLDLKLPSDPRMLSAIPGKLPFEPTAQARKSSADAKKARDAAVDGQAVLGWRCKARSIREVGMDALRWVDGANYASRWSSPFHVEFEPEEEEVLQAPSSLMLEIPQEIDRDDQSARITPITRRPSARRRMSSMIIPADAEDGSVASDTALLP